MFHVFRFLYFRSGIYEYMKRYLPLLLLITHLFLIESYGRESSFILFPADYTTSDDFSDNQGMFVNAPFRHGVIFNEVSCSHVISVQTFTLRFHFRGKSSVSNIFYQKFESSLSQNIFVRISKLDSKAQFTKLRTLQI